MTIATRNSVVLPAGVWVDLYAETAIGLGTGLNIQGLVKSRIVYLVDANEEPSLSNGRTLLEDTDMFECASSAIGAWAYCAKGSVLQVEVA